MKYPTFDVIIPVYRPGKSFFRLLAALQTQTIRPQRIILLYTSRRGERLRLPKVYSSVQVHSLVKAAFDHGGTRNLGAAYARAQVLVFMTQDALPQDNTLFAELLQPFSDAAVAVTYARQLPKASASVQERYFRRFNYPPKAQKKTAADVQCLGVKAYFCSDVCAAYRRDRFEEAGGFDAPVLFNEDMLLAAKLMDKGYAVYYAARAMVVHSHAYSNRRQFRRNFDLGASQADHPEVFGKVKAEKEGAKAVWGMAAYLRETHRLYLLPSFILTCCFKYAGFFLGKHYRWLSQKQIRFCSTNPEYYDLNAKG